MPHLHLKKDQINKQRSQGNLISAVPMQLAVSSQLLKRSVIPSQDADLTFGLALRASYYNSKCSAGVKYLDAISLE